MQSLLSQLKIENPILVTYLPTRTIGRCTDHHHHNATVHLYSVWEYFRINFLGYFRIRYLC